jgi:hypothetical protein
MKPALTPTGAHSRRTIRSFSSFVLIREGMFQGSFVFSLPTAAHAPVAKRRFWVRLNGADHQWGKDPPKEVVG